MICAPEAQIARFAPDANYEYGFLLYSERVITLSGHAFALTRKPAANARIISTIVYILSLVPYCLNR